MKIRLTESKLRDIVEMATRNIISEIADGDLSGYGKFNDQPDDDIYANEMEPYDDESDYGLQNSMRQNRAVSGSIYNDRNMDFLHNGNTGGDFYDPAIDANKTLPHLRGTLDDKDSYISSEYGKAERERDAQNQGKLRKLSGKLDQETSGMRNEGKRSRNNLVTESFKRYFKNKF